MITCYFGVPGAGKNTLLTKLAIKELRRMKIGRSKYKHIYTDFHVDGCERIEYADLKKYKMYDSLILFQEMALDADNRKFKSFSDELRDFFVLHRHLNCDIVYCTQNYDLVDLKIRALTQELWYMSKSVVPFFSNFTLAKRIYRCVNINEHSADLVLGYRFCNLIESLFVSNCKIVFRPFYYRYFDSYEEGQLEDREEFVSEPWNVENKEKDIQLLAQLLDSAHGFKENIEQRFKKKEPKTEKLAFEKDDEIEELEFIVYEKCEFCACNMCPNHSSCCEETCEFRETLCARAG